MGIKSRRINKTMKQIAKMHRRPAKIHKRPRDIRDLEEIRHEAIVETQRRGRKLPR